MPAPRPPIEHVGQLEIGERSAHNPVEVARTRWPVYRYVCTCGATTKWWDDLNRARAERDAHALDGQLSLDV